MTLSKIYHYLINKLKVVIYFIIPNFYRIVRKQILFSSKFSNFHQKTFITGTGQVSIGESCSFGYKLGGFHYNGSIEIQPRYKKSKIAIGHRVLTNNNIFICAANYIEIGDQTLIGQNVTITDYEAHSIEPDKRNELGAVGEVIIGKNVWIGSNVTILKNSYIGINSIIAAGAVVSGDFPSNVIIGGIPAKIICNIDV